MLSIRESLEKHGMKALYYNKPARVLPVDHDLEKKLNQSNLATPVKAGEMIIKRWEDEEKMSSCHSASISKTTGIDFVFDRTDGGYEIVPAGSGVCMANATLQIFCMEDDESHNPGTLFVKEAFADNMRLLRCIRCYITEQKEIPGLTSNVRDALMDGEKPPAQALTKLPLGGFVPVRHVDEENVQVWPDFS